MFLCLYTIRLPQAANRSSLALALSILDFSLFPDDLRYLSARDKSVLGS